jgi:hypothetical protein
LATGVLVGAALGDSTGLGDGEAAGLADAAALGEAPGLAEAPADGDGLVPTRVSPVVATVWWLRFSPMGTTTIPSAVTMRNDMAPHSRRTKSLFKKGTPHELRALARRASRSAGSLAAPARPGGA